MSVLETRKSEALRLFRSVQARFGPRNLDLQKLSKNRPKKKKKTKQTPPPKKKQQTNKQTKNTKNPKQNKNKTKPNQTKKQTNEKKNCDTRELPKLSGWSVKEQDRDSITGYFSWFSTPSSSFLLVYVFRGNISTRSVLDREVRVLDVQNGQRKIRTESILN